MSDLTKIEILMIALMFVLLVDVIYLHVIKRIRNRPRCMRCGDVLKKKDKGWHCESCRKIREEETIKFD
jgi:tRNA(Ile2) C34 agmatinyltransferase TiaS